MSQISSDNFNRANSAGLGANWTVPVGNSGNFDVTSNQAKANGTNVIYYSGADWTSITDQYCEVQAVVLESGKDTGPIIRATGATLATQQAYLFVMNDADAAVSLGSSISCAIYKLTTGQTFTQIGTSASTTINANDFIRIEAQGTTIRLKVNGVVFLTQTDATLASGNAGLYLGSGTNTIFDNWSAGDLNTRKNTLLLQAVNASGSF